MVSKKKLPKKTKSKRPAKRFYPAKAFTLKRSEWGNGRLYNPETGEFCALGKWLYASGMTKAQLAKDNGYERANKKFESAWNIYRWSDGGHEQALVDAFAKYGVTLTIVD